MGDTDGEKRNPHGRQDAVPTANSSDGSVVPSGRIGKYKILSILGEGGYGMVYLAEQQGLVKRRVALKVIKPGMDTKQVIARFEVERQALALLDHPNIAQVYDAGTTEMGRPYFVMEYVKGVPITEHCDRYKSVIEDRLALFMKICEAVQHAHQKGIIHRDIKPSNIIVAIEGNTAVPKIIDFGVAKALSHFLTERTLVTEHGQMLGTPEYMSPEQAEMTAQDIDTRSDIYSLGVVLYELLTGALPFDPKELREGGMEHIRHVICEQEPKTPSTRLSREESVRMAQYRRVDPAALQRRLRGDLDWITLKAMAKDRIRRYSSVGEFAADIMRHINNEPVLAGPPSTIYRFQKFVRRNRAIVIGAAAVLVVLMVGIAVSTLLAVGQTRARVETQSVADFLTNDLLGLVVPEKAKSPEVTVRYVLDAASKNLEDKFEGKLIVEASIRQTLGETYRKLGDYEAARPHLERAYEIRRAQLGDDDPATLTSMSQLGWLYYLQTRYDQAEPLLVKAMEARKRLLGEEHADTLESMTRVATLYFYQGRAATKFSELEGLFTKSFETARRVLGEEHPVTLQAMWSLVEFYTIVGAIGGGIDQVEPLCVRGLEISRRVLGEEHEITLHFTIYLAIVYRAQGRYDEALPMAMKVLETSQRVLGEEHPVTLKAMCLLGRLYQSQNQYDEAEPLLEKTVQISSSTMGNDQMWTQFYMGYLAQLRRDQGRYSEAETLLFELVKTARRSLHHVSVIMWSDEIADLYAMQGRYEEAKALKLEEIEQQITALGDDNPAMKSALIAELAWGFAVHYIPQMRDGPKAVQYATQACELTKWKDFNFIDTLAAAYAEAGDFKSAVKWQKKAIDLASGPLQAAFESRLELYKSNEPLHLSPWRGNVGELIRAGHYQRAERILLSARATSARLLGEQHEETLVCIKELINLYEAWGKPDEAEKWRASLSNKEQANE